MRVETPTFTPTMIISDDAYLAARLSCVFARRGQYLAVIDGPRMMRSDHSAEVIRRANAVARARPEQLLLAGLFDDALAAMQISCPTAKSGAR